MKKLLTLLLSLLMVFTLVGCGSKPIEEQPVDVPIADVTEPEEEPIVGGWTEVADRTLTDELKEIFNKAKEGYVGMSLEPVELYQTQVVAGTNYKFVCSGTKTTNPPISGTYFVTVYKDLEGNCSIIDVETVTESTGDVDGDPVDEDVLKTYKYWVVFYNPDGSELYRTKVKYGNTPTYEGEEPVYWDSDYWYKFVCWTDKKGNEVKEFKPIKGNKYYYAKYEVGGELKQDEEESGLVTVTFYIGGSGSGYMQEKNVITSWYPDNTQMQFAIGTSFSINGKELTIDGTTYIPYEVNGEMFDHWECNNVTVTSGQILEDSILNAVFGPPN